MKDIAISPDTPIEAIRFPRKIYTILHRCGHKTVEDIQNASCEELKSIPGIGDNALLSVNAYLNCLRYGPLQADPVPSVMEYVKSWKNDCERKAMLHKLNGIPIKSIAATIGIPESRIREKIRKVLMYRPALYENRYIDIYRKYNFTCEDFCKLFGVEPYVYHYLSMINPKQRGTEPAQNAKSDSDIQRLISEK